MKVKGTNQIFGEQTLASLVGNNLTINHSGDAYSEISANTFTDYVLEIEHSSTPSGNREIKLYNVVIGDGFGGTIDDLNNHSNIIPSDINFYKY